MQHKRSCVALFDILREGKHYLNGLGIGLGVRPIIRVRFLFVIIVSMGVRIKNGVYARGH